MASQSLPAPNTTSLTTPCSSIVAAMTPPTSPIDHAFWCQFGVALAQVAELPDVQTESFRDAAKRLLEKAGDQSWPSDTAPVEPSLSPLPSPKTDRSRGDRNNSPVGILEKAPPLAPSDFMTPPDLINRFHAQVKSLDCRVPGNTLVRRSMVDNKPIALDDIDTEQYTQGATSESQVKKQT
ncbi:hypothetical protein H4R33_001635 [Dimargaris cristalligena]|nr:hypothetical protein H4R33_001635 [Dimargaris cristalligena]